jgi:DNA-binding XRE family transcriptional regulator
MPSYEIMSKIAKVLGVPIEEIFFNNKVVVSANENNKGDKSEQIERERRLKQKVKQKKN